ncbi:PLDc N-terminal domain-containing protein [Cerasicoccus maritimus]|uniref:PLDc N-terminal domain-containing protein n=1 Tax=Cerasicoccus maritimus TaxID=490089 RepID=UPI00285290CE|nr:PLDc N-terminal domain-containing protein [Cerasicoccus maritimus]
MSFPFELGPGLVAIIAIVETIWLFAVVCHTRENDMRDVDKICWMVVLCTLNVVGLVLYILFAPFAVRSFREAKRVKPPEKEGLFEI